MKKTFKYIITLGSIISMLTFSFMSCQQPTGGKPVDKETIPEVKPDLDTNTDQAVTPEVDPRDAVLEAAKKSLTIPEIQFNPEDSISTTVKLPDKVENIDGATETISVNWSLLKNEEHFKLKGNSLTLNKDFAQEFTNSVQATITYKGKKVIKQFEISIPAKQINFTWENNGAKRTVKTEIKTTEYGPQQMLTIETPEKIDTFEITSVDNKNNTMRMSYIEKKTKNNNSKDSVETINDDSPYLYRYDIDWSNKKIKINTTFDEDKPWDKNGLYPKYSIPDSDKEYSGYIQVTSKTNSFNAFHVDIQINYKDGSGLLNGTWIDYGSFKNFDGSNTTMYISDNNSVKGSVQLLNTNYTLPDLYYTEQTIID